MYFKVKIPFYFVLGGNYNYINTEKSTLLVRDSIIENDPALINESTGQTGIIISSSGVLTLENTTVKGGLRDILIDFYDNPCKKVFGDKIVISRLDGLFYI